MVTLVVNPPFKGQHRVIINPLLLDSSNLLSAIVDIEYEEADSGYRVTYQEEFDGAQPLAS